MFVQKRKVVNKMDNKKFKSAVELLKKHASENENLIVSLATTEVFEAIDFLKNNKVDLIFTDIQMHYV